MESLREAGLQADFREIQESTELAAWLDLLNRSFPVPPGASFLDDFPAWGSKGSDVLRVGGFFKGRLVSCAGARLSKLKTARGALPIGIVGAVASEKEFRGRGLASRAVESALDWLRNRGARLAVLWGSEHRMYQRLGFELCGMQGRIPLSEIHGIRKIGGKGLGKKGLVGGGLGEGLGEGWTSGLFPRLQQREGGLELRESDRAWIKAHRNVKWIWSGSPTRPTAYAAIGKGMDLQGMVHEWGGSVPELMGVLAEVYLKWPDAVLLGPPRALERLGTSTSSLALEYLCMAKPLDGSTLQEWEGAPLWFWGLDSS